MFDINEYKVRQTFNRLLPEYLKIRDTGLEVEITAHPQFEVRQNPAIPMMPWLRDRELEQLIQFNFMN